MNNEIGRKITSLTLMTIMLAGGMTIAAPSMVPDAHAANATLFVSAENSTYNNTFGGAQVVEVVVSDPSIASLDDVHGAPDVEVNGSDVSMAQGSDGSWYAYIADKTYADVADADNGGLEFGYLCANTETANLHATNTISYLETQGYYSETACNDEASAAIVTDAAVDISAATNFFTILAPFTDAGVAAGIAAVGGELFQTGIITVTSSDGAVDLTEDVVFTDLDGDGAIDCTGVAAADCELADIAAGVTFNFTTDAGGADEVAFAQATETYTVLTSEKSLNGNDNGNLHTASFGGNGWENQNNPIIQLYNFNPTGQVTVEYNKAGTNEVSTLTYDTTTDLVEVDVDRTRAPQGAMVHVGIGDPQLNIDPTSEDSWAFNSSSGLAYYGADQTNAVPVADLMFESNGVFKITKNSVLEDNQTNQDTTTGATIGISLYETGANTSYFTTYDDDDNSVIKVAAAAPRGTAGTLDYNDSPLSIVASTYFADIQMDESSVGNEWNSGEELSVILIDEDLNLNSRADEDLDLNTVANTLIPSLKIGTPLSLGVGAIVEGDTLVAADIDDFSSIARVLATVADQDIDITSSFSADNLNTMFAAADFVYLNYDIRSLANGGTATTLQVKETNDAGTVVATGTISANQGLIQLTEVAGLDAAAAGSKIYFEFDMGAGAAHSTVTGSPVVMDIFSFGDSVNNAIYRMELEESGDNTSEFIGSIEYVMINQTNLVAATFTGLTTISNDIVVLVVANMTDEDAPRVNYLDMGADGVSTQIADQQDAPSHSGVVDLDLDNYKVADTVNVTLTDMDLNVDSNLIDVFTTQASSQVDGDLLSTTTHVLDITFNDVAYDGLNGTGFTLTETDAASGIFVGSFQVPATY
ncbi:MAG: hypothetical protein HOB51_01605, partial [Thaumarchaeota archaeon]|nr:hypothetical protein [Nitrososphaerota archaeon]